MNAIEQGIAAMKAARVRMVEADIERGAKCYDRARDLPKLVGGERRAAEIVASGDVIGTLRRAVTAAQNSVRGDSPYASTSRLLGLRQALRGEEVRAGI